jgi:hypothetical protein
MHIITARKYGKPPKKNDHPNVMGFSGIEPEAGLEPATLR